MDTTAQTPGTAPVNPVVHDDAAGAALVGQPQPQQDTSWPVSPSDSQVPDPGFGYSGGDKERVVGGPISPVELRGPVEQAVASEYEPEVDSFVEKMVRSEDIHMPEPVKDDLGNVVLADASAQVLSDFTLLPLTQAEYEEDKKLSVTSSGRWLAEWCSRVIKQLQNAGGFRSA